MICQQPQCMDRAGKKVGRNLQKTTRRWYCGTCCMKRATWAQLFQWDPQVQGWKQLLKACWHCQVSGRRWGGLCYRVIELRQDWRIVRRD